MTDLVVDASFVAKVVYPEPHREQAIALIREAAEKEYQMTAPALLYSELMNVVRRRQRQEREPLAVALASLDILLGLPIETVDDRSLHRDTLRLSQRCSLSVFDALYVALAGVRVYDFRTGDRKLLNAIGGRLPSVRWIGDYRLSIT